MGEGRGNDFSTLRPRSNVWINSAITQERAADYVILKMFLLAIKWLQLLIFVDFMSS